MGLNIKNPDTEKLIRELAQLRGQGITEVLTDVIGREVERERKKPAPNDLEARRRRIDKIIEEYNSLPLRDDRTADEIIGYNENGLFD